MLTVERSIDAAERHALRPQRARILPAGAVIVDAILERYGVDRLQVSEEGIREGAVLAAAAAGAAWRDRLRFLVAGWDDEAPTTGQRGARRSEPGDDPPERRAGRRGWHAPPRRPDRPAQPGDLRSRSTR